MKCPPPSLVMSIRSTPVYWWPVVTLLAVTFLPSSCIYHLIVNDVPKAKRDFCYLVNFFRYSKSLY